MSDALIDSLTAAVEARPDDLPLRLHLAELLVAAGRGAEAIAHAAQVLAREPGDPTAQRLMASALGKPAAPAAEQVTPAAQTPAGQNPTAEPAPDRSKVDWAALEQQFGDVVPPRFTSDGEPDPAHGHQDRIFDVERSTITLADVGGMADVKKRLEVSFLGPLRNPKLLSLIHI